jgi:hypothetical protein
VNNLVGSGRQILCHSDGHSVVHVGRQIQGPTKDFLLSLLVIFALNYIPAGPLQQNFLIRLE